jgi:hypothetical protein
MVGVSAPDPVERYLDQLLAELHGTAGNIRRVLAEVEHHLRDAIDEGTAQGLPLEEARRRALERFGSPRTVARQFASPARRLVSAAVLGQLILAVALLGGIGLVAIGVSGVVAQGMGMAFGKTFVAGDPPGVTYTPARCADFLEYYPSAPSCADAAVDHHFDETVQYRVAAGVLGLLVLGGWWLARRRAPRSLGLLPDGFVATVGASLFGLVGGFLVLSSVDQLVFGVDGAGQNLSGGIVSLLVALAFLVSLNRTLARRAALAET